MKVSTTIATASALMATGVVAAPLASRAGLVAADIVAQIAPKSVSCDGAKVPDECRTNKEVGPALVQAMVAYEIYSPGAMASIISLVAFESGDFQYKRNLQHDGEDPIHWGQGTSNMQMAKFNLEFANSFPELAPSVTALGSFDNNKDTQNKVLDLIVDDKYNFKSGPWFYATKCQAAHAAFENGGDLDAAFSQHMECVLGQGAITDDRMQYWTAAKKAFGLT